LLAHVAFFVAEQHTMRIQDRAASGIRFQTGDDVLPEGVIGAPLRRCAIQVASIRVFLERGAIPTVNRVGRIGDNDIKLLESAALTKIWVSECVTAHNSEV